MFLSSWFFKHCPYPEEKQRKELSIELGLEPMQIKFWFQNKRTQMKTQQERIENAILKAENERLGAENNRYKEALINATCPNCGGSAAHGEMSLDDELLKIENARLRIEIERISEVAAKYASKPVTSLYSNPSSQNNNNISGGNCGAQSGMGGEMNGGSDLLRSFPASADSDKLLIVELAVAAMEELTKLAHVGDPLWVPTNNHTQTLNEDEYKRTFPIGIGPKPIGLRSEASRESIVVFMNHLKLVDILMAVMSAEFHVPSPLVPTRENYFVRYCKQQPDGAWAVVDVSLDNLQPPAISRSRRRPSGCLIQELPNGYSKVTWIEHVEVDDRAVHNMYRPLVSSGLAFGAKRWLAALDRQCQRIASSMATNIPPGDFCVSLDVHTVVTSPEGRKSMLKLAERMVNSYCTGVGASTANAWTTLSATGCEDVRVMTRKSVDDPGRPLGIVLSAATSFWLPVPPRRVFDFFRDLNSRSGWDILTNGGVIQEMAHITNGRDPGNSVSLLRVNSANPSQNNMLILQESYTDATGSYLVYAPVDIAAMNIVMSGGDPDYIPLLPSGFAILPDGRGPGVLDVGSGGSLLTVAFQILVDSAPTAKISLDSVATVTSLIKCSVERIKVAFAGDINPRM
ncbi:hypothetical protein RJT34_05075 [Clitoria ternatea]|uniref:Uncharacterized protein n=1 Tax=Clitoria ternatea TaxID=43366 RepID=A0AAN9K109_CLITE